jgi:hypothetical protein
MSILTLQQRSRELGRIRIGQTVTTDNGRTRPTKLDRFRVTSPSRPLVEQVAHLYGGTVQAWTPLGGGAQQWEVVTDTTRLPVLVPPQPVTQFFEHWTGGGCKRRCDGITELLSDQPCICGPDPADRLCRPTTRLNVVLRDVPGIGVWRLESHGYYAAVELPQSAHFLATAGGYVAGWLALEARRVVRDVDEKPQTRDFMVPILEIDLTPAELLAGRGEVTPEAVDARPGPVAAIDTGPAAPTPDYRAEAKAATDLDQVRAVWHRASAAGHLDDTLQADLKAIADALAAPATETPEPDVDATWQQIVDVAGQLGLTLTDIEAEFAQTTEGLHPGSADGHQLLTYLTNLRWRAGGDAA